MSPSQVIVLQLPDLSKDLSACISGSSGPRINMPSDAPCNYTDYLNKEAERNKLAKDGVTLEQYRDAETQT